MPEVETRSVSHTCRDRHTLTALWNVAKQTQGSDRIWAEAKQVCTRCSIQWYARCSLEKRRQKVNKSNALNQRRTSIPVHC